MAQEADARGRAMLGALVRARSRFDVAAISRLMPGLSSVARAAALGREQSCAMEWERQARERILSRLEVDGSQQAALAQLPCERQILAARIAQTAASMSARADISDLRVAGDTHGYWLRSDQSCEEGCARCQRFSGRLWPLDVLERELVERRRPDCGCRAIGQRTAALWGMSFGDPITLTEAGHPADAAARVPTQARDAYEHLADSSATVMDAVRRVEEYARSDSMSGAAADRLARVLREATVSVWREKDHPRGKSTARSNHGSFRSKGMHPLAGDLAPYFSNVGGVPDHMQPAPTASTTGARDRVPLALGIPQRGLHGGWAEGHQLRRTFMWEVGDGELGPEHEGLTKAARGSRLLQVSDLPGGRTRIESAAGRAPGQGSGDARRLEVLAPQLRATRVMAPGVDLSDTRPLDPRPDETLSSELTWYPRVSSRRLGDSTKSLINAVGARMIHLGLMEHGARVEFPSLADRKRKGPLDWVLGARGIDVRSQSMRSLSLGGEQRATTFRSDERARKIATIHAQGLRGSLVQSYVGVDNDVAHMFLYDYPDEETVFTEQRPYTALVDRLVAGTLRPGDEELPARGPHAGKGERRWIFLGSFRLAYNPYLARDPRAVRQPVARKEPRKPARAQHGDTGARRRAGEPSARAVVHGAGLGST